MDLKDRCYDQLAMRLAEIREMLDDVPLGENRQLLDDALKWMEDKLEETLTEKKVSDK